MWEWHVGDSTYMELARRSNYDYEVINYYKKAVDAGLEYGD